MRIPNFVGFIIGMFFCAAMADTGTFDSDRWSSILDNVRERATAQNISNDIIDDTLRNPAFIPSIIKSDKNQAEFKLTLDEYLNRTVNLKRISRGQKMRTKYNKMLNSVDEKYGVPPHVILAFWGMESNYGDARARHRLVDAFLTLMYDGRREKFFGEQLLALMKIADDNGLDINNIRGSWAGAMGHFQFIPTTLASYGADGDMDGKIDIIDNLDDAMASAGNYLGKLGWDKTQRIARRVMIPADFDVSLMDGKTKKTLQEWAAMGVTNADGGPLPAGNMTAGLVADATNNKGSGVMTAYLTYPNFYRIKKWNNSNWYAIAIAELAEKFK